MARERPHLAPITDSVTVTAVGTPGSTWRTLRRCFQDPVFRLWWAAASMVYWRAMCTRSSASESSIRSPLTSTVTLWMVPVNLNGLA